MITWALIVVLCNSPECKDMQVEKVEFIPTQENCLSVGEKWKLQEPVRYRGHVCKAQIRKDVKV